MPILLVLILAGGLFYLTWSRRQHRSAPDIGWASVSGPVLTAGEPYDDPAASPAMAQPGSMRVSTTLARIEGRRLLVSPLVIVGYALSLIIVLFLLDAGIPDESEWLGFVLTRVPLMIFPFCGMLLLAVNRATLRARRDGTEELFSSLPAPRIVRSNGHLLSLVWPGVVGAVIVGLIVVAAVAGSGKTDEALLSFGPMEQPVPWSIALAYASAAVVLVFCAGALGVGLARLVPYSLAALASFAVIIIFTGATTGSASDASRSLAPFTYPRTVPAIFSVEVPWPHVIYLLGLGWVAVGAIWLLDGARRRGLVTVGAAAAVAAVAWAVPVVFPDESRFETVAAMVSSPEDHQRCVEGATATYCAYEPFERWTDEWAEAVQPVIDAAPPGALDQPLRVTQRLPGEEVAELDQRVRARLEPEALRTEPHTWPVDDAVHPDLRWSEESFAIVAITTGNRLAGLPSSGTGLGPCYVGGQARGVVALWLAAHSIGTGRAIDLYRPHDQWYGDLNDYGSRDEDLVNGKRRYLDLLPPFYTTDASPTVVWDVTDLELTRALLIQPPDAVRSVLHDEWATVTDPDTSTDDLAALFGLNVGRPGAGPEGISACR